MLSIDNKILVICYLSLQCLMVKALQQKSLRIMGFFVRNS